MNLHLSIEAERVFYCLGVELLIESRSVETQDTTLRFTSKARSQKYNGKHNAKIRRNKSRRTRTAATRRRFKLYL
jgi:hypothetical protein